MVPPVQLILKMDLFALNDRITDKCPAVQIFPFHVNCGDLMIFVSGVVVDALGGIAAGCVECELIFAVCNFTAASLLVNGAKDMENWLTLSSSESPDLAFILVKATRTKREAEERSPGSPSAPMPRL